jgi:ferredoxin
MDEDDIAQVRAGADLDSGCIQDAIDECPVSAITI